MTIEQGASVEAIQQSWCCVWGNPRWDGGQGRAWNRSPRDPQPGPLIMRGTARTGHLARDHLGGRAPAPPPRDQRATRPLAEEGCSIRGDFESFPSPGANFFNPIPPPPTQPLRPPCSTRAASRLYWQDAARAEAERGKGRPCTSLPREELGAGGTSRRRRPGPSGPALQSHPRQYPTPPLHSAQTAWPLGSLVKSLLGQTQNGARAPLSPQNAYS